MNTQQWYIGRNNHLNSINEKLLALGFIHQADKWLNFSKGLVIPHFEGDATGLSKYLRQIAFNRAYSRELRLKHYALYEALFRLPYIKPYIPPNLPKGSGPNNGAA